MVDSRSAVRTPRLVRVLLWSAVALVATGLSNGCGGGDENADIYDVTVSVQSTTDLNSLHFKLFADFNDGDFIGHGDDLDCTVLVDADLESHHFGSDPGVPASLELRLSNDEGFAVPAAVLRCGARTSETLRPDSFQIEFLDATNIVGSPTEADIEITSVELRP